MVLRFESSSLPDFAFLALHQVEVVAMKSVP